jgi:hypothetical protein
VFAAAVQAGDVAQQTASSQTYTHVCDSLDNASSLCQR